MKKINRIISAVMLAALACSAHAGVFDGTTVNFQYYYPDLSSPYANSDSGSYFVGAGGANIVNLVDGVMSMNIQGNDLTVTIPDASSTFTASSFNGFEIYDPSVNFTSFSMIYNSALSGTPVLSFAGDNLSVNWQSISFNPGTVQFAVTGNVSAVPEPETYAMLLAGLGLIGFMAYRRKSDSSNMPRAA
ncbi:MAG: PEP-CTERM sorting domain-containing protein [Gallionella sp.]